MLWLIPLDAWAGRLLIWVSSGTTGVGSCRVSNLWDVVWLKLDVVIMHFIRTGMLVLACWMVIVVVLMFGSVDRVVLILLSLTWCLFIPIRLLVWLRNTSLVLVSDIRLLEWQVCGYFRDGSGVHGLVLWIGLRQWVSLMLLTMSLLAALGGMGLLVVLMIVTV